MDEHGTKGTGKLQTNGSDLMGGLQTNPILLQCDRTTDLRVASVTNGPNLSGRSRLGALAECDRIDDPTTEVIDLSEPKRSAIDPKGRTRQGLTVDEGHVSYSIV